MPDQSCSQHLCGRPNPNFAGPHASTASGDRASRQPIQAPSATLQLSGRTQAAPTGPFIAPSQLAATTAFPNGSPFAPTTPSRTPHAPHRTTSTVLVTTSSTSLWFAASRCTSANHPSWISGPRCTTSPTTRCFGVPSTAVGNSSFGDVTNNANYTRKAAQLSGTYRVLSL